MRTTEHETKQPRDESIGAITLPQPPSVGARTMALAGFGATSLTIGMYTWPTSHTH